MLLKELAEIYYKLIRKIPEMTGIEYAREHGRITTEELEASDKEADEAIAEMDATLKQWQEKTIKEWKRQKVIKEIEKMKEKLITYNKICQQTIDKGEKLEFDISFHRTLSKEILWRIDTLSSKTDLTTYWRIAWIWDEIVQRLEKINIWEKTRI